MMDDLEKKYPSTILVAVGFSLGGNIVTKYFGEKNDILPKNMIGGISICQGYNAVKYVVCDLVLKQKNNKSNQLLYQLLLYAFTQNKQGHE